MHVDPRLLAPALAHLLENAAQYSPKGATITVTHEVASAGIGLAVEDEGVGIADKDLPHLFERFYRGGESHRHGSGTGMGLAIVQGLLAAQGGSVRVENRAEGGSRFSIFVPTEIRHARPRVEHTCSCRRTYQTITKSCGSHESAAHAADLARHGI